jgi:regulatory protein
MSQITAILPSVRKPGRFELVVDGAAFATIGLDTIERLGLGVGRSIDGVRDAVEAEAAALATYDRAVNMLAARARSASDLKRQLVRKGEPAPLVDAAIEKLRAAGFLDDAAFARAFARSKALGAGASKRRLQQELSRRGVARDVGEEAVAEVFEEEEIDEGESVERLARKRLRSLARLDAATRDRRLWSFLARRGYDADVIRRAIERVTGEDVDAGADAPSEDEEEGTE